MPIIYGLPKIHKNNIPLRPIVSFINAPTYKLSKFLCNEIGELQNKLRYSVSNSTKMMEIINDLNIRDINIEDYQMVSFDITSLYTNVPTDVALKVVREMLEEYTEVSEKLTLGIDLTCDLIELCLKDTYFSFMNKIYHQKYGLAMGSPISSLLANITIFELEKTILPNLEQEICIWVRYIDDVFALVKHGSINKILNAINDFNTRIKFTHEIEDDSGLPFLDLKLFRSNGKIATKVYTKPTHTGQTLNFNANCPNEWKISAVRSLSFRAENFCSRPNDKMEERNRVKFELMTNNYPIKFINRHWYRPKLGLIENKREFKATIVLPWSTSGPGLKRILESCNVRTRFMGNTKIGLILKDKICKRITTKLDNQNVVYRVPCKDCNAAYIGETERPLHVRFNEHKAGIKNNRWKVSKIVEHCLYEKHEPNWSNSTILQKHAPSWRIRTFLESAHSIQEPYNLNKFNYLPDTYRFIINRQGLGKVQSEIGGLFTTTDTENLGSTIDTEY